MYINMICFGNNKHGSSQKGREMLSIWAGMTVFGANVIAFGFPNVEIAAK